MAVRPIIRWPNPVLTTPAAPVEAFDASLAQLLADLAETMRAAKGLGLAATQIGVPQRVAVAMHPTALLLVELVNPVYVALDNPEHRVKVTEACLSVPGERHLVPRYPRVQLRYQDRAGQHHLEEAEGEWAQVIQHEVDHVEGRLYVDYLAPTRRAFIRQQMLRLPPMWEPGQG